MRKSVFAGFARAAYRNLRRAEELRPDVDAEEREHELYVDAEMAKLKSDPEAKDGVYAFMHISALRNEMHECCASIIVMAHAALEAYIYDHAGMVLGDALAEELDKLSATGKWLIIPRMTKGFAFEKSRNEYGLLKGLTAKRNLLAHPKSKRASLEDQEGGLDLLAEARNAIRALEAMKALAEEFDDSDAPHLMLTDNEGVVLGKEARQRIESEMAAKSIPPPK